MLFKSKVILIHCLLFSLLCASQFSNLQLLSSDFTKDIALQGIMHLGGQVKIIAPNIGCHLTNSVACDGLWSCSEYICERNRKYKSSKKLIIIDLNDDYMISCNVTNTKNVFYDSETMEKYFVVINNIFMIMPFIIGICILLSISHAICMHYYSDSNITSFLGFLTMFYFVISRLSMVILVVVNYIYKINCEKLGEFQPAILFNKFFISTIWLIVYSIIELIVGLFELFILKKMVTNTFNNVNDKMDYLN